MNATIDRITYPGVAAIVALISAALIILLYAVNVISPTISVFIAIFIALLLLRQPIIILVAIATAFVHVYFARNSSVEYLIQDMWFTLDREVLLSIPMFILAGALMARGSIARRLIAIMTAIAGPLPGGLAVACVLACSVFAAISGSSIVTLIAVGTIAYPALIENGYTKRFAIGLICAAGSLGIMIPPSIAMILFGIMTETSVTRLFLAGVGPGLLLVLMLSVYAILVNRKLPVQPFDFWAMLRALKSGILALLMPVLLLGGIYSGWFSPTEAAAVALAYALFVEVVVYRELTLANYGGVLKETIVLLGKLLPLVAIASSLNTILDYEGITQNWVASIGGAISDPILLMLGVNLLLLAVGCLMEVSSAMVVLSPLLTPLMTNAGWDPVHFGIVMTANLEIGYLTPPVGLNLVVAMVAFKEDFLFVCRAVLPFLAIMLIWLMAVSFLPELSLYLTR
jgi:C4-dicarboxylate transporter DctM subunit